MAYKPINRKRYMTLCGDMLAAADEGGKPDQAIAKRIAGLFEKPGAKPLRMDEAGAKELAAKIGSEQWDREDVSGLANLVDSQRA